MSIVEEFAKNQKSLKEVGTGSGMLDETTVEMIKKEKEGNEKGQTVFERLSLQEPSCEFGELGICCRMCYMGPCRITSFAGGHGAITGVCGASADTIVARNLLRETVGGAASHTEHAMEIAQTLKKVAEGKLEGYMIKDTEKLLAVAKMLGIETDNKDYDKVANAVADISLAEFTNLRQKPSVWTKAYAPKSSFAQWEKLGIVPRGSLVHIMNAMHRTSMGNDADPVNILLADIQMGIIDGYMGLTMATELSDVLFGTPKPVHSYANVGVLKKDYVNIAVHGHNPMLSEKILESAAKLSEKAEKAGAKGINIVGVCCTGNEVLMRHGIPILGNEIQAESALATSAIDAMVVDFQCIWPVLGQVASCFHTKLITTVPYVKIPGAMHIEFEPEKADEVAMRIVEEGIDAYTKRNPSRVFIPDKKEEIYAGFSTESIIELLSKANKEDPLKPLIDNIVSGNIYGIVAIVGCPNPKTRRITYTERFVAELLKHNILVIVTGCIAHITAQKGFMNPEKIDSFDIGDKLKGVLKTLGSLAGLKSLPATIHMGSCVDNSRIGVLLKAVSEKLNVKVSDLPVAASAPELITEKAVSIGTWALAIGLPVHTCPPLRVVGGENVNKILKTDLRGITGGELYTECNPEEAAKGLVEKIKEKRANLNLQV